MASSTTSNPSGASGSQAEKTTRQRASDETRVSMDPSGGGDSPPSSGDNSPRFSDGHEPPSCSYERSHLGIQGACRPFGWKRVTVALASDYRHLKPRQRPTTQSASLAQEVLQAPLAQT